MRLWLCPNVFNEEQIQQAGECYDLLNRSGRHQCALSEENSRLLFGDDSGCTFSPEVSDLFVSLGGDGSVLRAAKQAIRFRKPLLGINSGRLGYLCGMSLKDADRFDEALASCTVSERMLLQLEYDGVLHYAMNDAIVAKSRFGETVDLKIHIDSDAPFHLRGDGLIISTPTGSTAYNLSAGGPIMEPSADVLCLTPICPHDTFSHPLILSGNRRVSVTARDENAGIYLDGQLIGNLRDGITIHAAPEKLKLFFNPKAAVSIIH